MTHLKESRNHPRRAGWSMKRLFPIGLGLFLFTLSACTEVTVTVHAPSTGTRLTGTNCKLQRELINQNQKTDYWCWAATAHTVISYIKNEKLDQCLLVDAVNRERLDSAWETLKRNLPPGGEIRDDRDIPRDNPIDSPVPISADATPTCCMSEMVADPKPVTTNIGIAQNICWMNGWPEYVFSTLEFAMNYEGFEYDIDFPGPQGLNWDEIVTEICEDRPMITAISYSKTFGGGSHTVVIGGYSELEDGSKWVQVYDPGFNTNDDDYYIWPYDVYLGDPGVFTHVRDYKNISLP